MQFLARRLSGPRFMLSVRVSTVGLGVLLLAMAAFWTVAVSPAQRPKPVAKTSVTLGTADVELARHADLGVPQPVAQAPAAVAPPVQGVGQLKIPSVGITGAVYPVGVDKTNTMEVTQNAFTVGWYKYGPLPGAGGDAVEECHNEWYTAPRALCYTLHNVAVGADVYTTNPDGAQHHWKVTKVTTVPYNANVPGLFDTSGGPRLSIITCGGTWLPKQQIFTQRVIVDAVLAQTA